METSKEFRRNTTFLKTYNEEDVVSRPNGDENSCHRKLNKGRGVCNEPSASSKFVGKRRRNRESNPGNKSFVKSTNCEGHRACALRRLSFIAKKSRESLKRFRYFVYDTYDVNNFHTLFCREEHFEL